MKRTMCRRCGHWFTTNTENTMCQYCIATVLSEIHPDNRPKKKTDTPQIVKDAKEAAEHGMSYGDWMASDERRMGK